MNVVFKFIIIALVVFKIIACSEKPQLSVDEINTMFREQYIFDWNIDSTHVLAIKKYGKISAGHLSPLEYLIYNAETDSVTFRETLSGGNVKWISTSLVQINIIPGNIIEDEELENYNYKFDVIKNKKISIGE